MACLVSGSLKGKIMNNIIQKNAMSASVPWVVSAIILIILPFIFWGMGDVFRTGNQNVLVTIDSDKISVQNFVNYLGQLNLTEKQRKELNKSGLLDKILSEYIGKKITNNNIFFSANKIILRPSKISLIVFSKKIFVSKATNCSDVAI